MTPWTPAREDRLRDLAAMGHSASEIAEALGGTTRGAVIGKCARLGIPLAYATGGKLKAVIEQQRRAVA